MKAKFFKAIIIFFISTSLWGAEDNPLYYSQVRYILSSPGSFGNGFLGYLNPAMASMIGNPELFIFLTDKASGMIPDRQWGMVGAFPHISFGAVNHKVKGLQYSDYRIACGFGDESICYGVSYGWVTGKRELSKMGRVFSTGMLVRPNPYLSVGIVGIFPQQQNDQQGVLDLGFRPLADGRITFFGDCALSSFSDLKRTQWSVGAVVQPLIGINIAARIYDNSTFSLGMSFSLGDISLRSHTHLNKDNKTLFNTYAVRVGAKQKNVFDSYFKQEQQYLSLSLKGPVAYQKYRLFDTQRNTLIDIIKNLKGAAADKRIAGVALNLSGIKAGKEILWEIRELLEELQQKGKKVVIYFDNCDMSTYHLASVADYVVMDPEGILILTGFSVSRTFMKGTLEKLGLGFQEWRFFKYKSANEVFSRHNMTEPDREQRLQLLEDFYTLAQKDICQARGFSPSCFDTLVNQQALFLSDKALEYELVDTLARWTEIENIIKKVEGKKKSLVGPQALACHSFQKTEWGSRPRVAVVYAIGACALDSGIKARILEKILLRLSESKSIKAVILRVDSPGGDPLASDLVAEAVQKCRKKKPVIISQGGLAASGGYWISMYGDTIVAAPNTITGSIGVIGGWLWNQGFGDKIGMQPDFVQVGKHADLGSGITLPFLGLTIPQRNLTSEEFSIMKTSITTMYKRFVKKVASGRNMPEAEVDGIGQGRVWSGTAGREKGLVDVMGGLDRAISIAQERAGMAADKKVEIVEFPPKGWINPELLKFKLFDITSTEGFDSPFATYLKMVTSHPAKPLVLLPADWWMTD